MATVQAAYRFGANDVSEAAHTFLAALDTPITRDIADASTFLLRILIQCNGGTSAANGDYLVQRAVNGGAFGNITTTSTVVKAVTTGIFANAANTTSRLGGTGTFETSSQGCSHDGDAGGAQFDIVADGRGEVLYSLQLVPADLTNGDVITFRLLFDGAASLTYTVTPQITITTTVDVTANALAGSLLLTGIAPIAAASSTVTTILAALAITGVAPASSATGDVTTSLGVLRLLGMAPTVDAGVGALTEIMTPNTILASSNLQDSGLTTPPALLTDLDDNPDGSPGPDELWWTAVDVNSVTDVRLGFPTSSGHLIGTQQIRVLVRGSSLPCRDVTVELWQAGNKLTSEVTESVSSIIGQVIVLEFEPGELSGSPETGADVEVRIFAAA